LASDVTAGSNSIDRAESSIGTASACLAVADLFGGLYSHKS
jgi:hypothetical protein